MNTFYKEQKKLMRQALNVLDTIEVLEKVTAEEKEIGKYPADIIDEASSKRHDELKTEYALTVTTLMQNFCQQLGFNLTQSKIEEAEVII